jgi:hypothetical protein
MYAARGLIDTGIAGGTDDIKRVVELVEKRGIHFKGEHVALVVGMFEDTLRIATTAQIRIEEKLAATAQQAARDKSGALSAEALQRAIETAGFNFTRDQKAGTNQQASWYA